MLNKKQFGCSKFLSVNFNDTQVCKGETSKKTYTQLKTSPKAVLDMVPRRQDLV